MDEAKPSRRRRWVLVAAAAVVIVVVGAVVLRAVVFRDRARVVSTDEALDRYRTQASSIPVDAAVSATTVAVIAPPTLPVVSPTASTAPASPSSTETSTLLVTTTVPSVPVALVAPGVYRYATRGQEHVDALDGTTHPYPPETTITVVTAGCGVSLRWDALRERWDEWQLCATPAGVVLGIDGIQYHEFFGQPDNQAVACDTPVMLIAAASDEQTPAQQACMLAEDPWLPLWTTLDRSPRTIDGQLVDVQHVQMQIEDDDEYWEHTTIDWYLAPDGLPVEVVATKSSLSPSPIGPIQYDEQYHLELESLTPLR
ncbi:MAG TPA: hypothetical protein VFD53_04635 [Ilumatobacter sp.]|nr:hypothetical protein [Ilumatobacter sp.]